jgi:hypothetical protein
MSEEVKPVTAAEAWEHVKFVYGFNAEFIRKRGESGASLMLRDGSAVGCKSVRTELPLYQKIEWTDGATEWPDRRWRTPTNADVQQKVEVRDRESEGWRPATFLMDLGEKNPRDRYAVVIEGGPGPQLYRHARIRAGLPTDAGMVKVQRNGKELLISRELVEDFDAIKSMWDSVWRQKHGMTIDEWIAGQAKSLCGDSKPEEPAKPAWEPKPGEWVKIKKPESVDYSYWHEAMDWLDGRTVLLSAPNSERRAVTGLVVVDANAPKQMENQWIIRPKWCSPAEPTQADRDATLWLHEGKVWRLATEADVGGIAIFEDYFSGPSHDRMANKLDYIARQMVHKFRSATGSGWKYAWVPAEPEPSQESKPAEKQYREPIIKDLATWKVVIVDVRNGDHEEWQKGYRLSAVLPDGEGFSHRFLTTPAIDDSLPRVISTWKQARIAVDGV